MTAFAMNPELLAELLRKSVAGEPWHGPGTLDLLSGVAAGQAARQPSVGGHAIWEIVLHMTGWQREVANRLAGHPPGMPAEGDWPAPLEPTALNWRRAVEALAASTEELALAVARLTPQDLIRTIGQSDRPLGTGVTIAEALVGVLQHNAYHSGQIALLKKPAGKV